MEREYLGYLGDRVYAQTQDGFLILTTDNSYPDDPRNCIYLDDRIFSALIAYVQRHNEDLGFCFRRPRSCKSTPWRCP